jgi:hypothetical protein
MLSLTVFARNIYRIYWRTQSRIFASRLNTIIVFCWGQCKFLWTLKTIFTEAFRLRWILISKVHKNSYWPIQKTVIVWFYLNNFIGYHAVTWHSVKFDIVWLKLVLTWFHFRFPLHYVWCHNEVINFILTWFHFHFSLLNKKHKKICIE